MHFLVEKDWITSSGLRAVCVMTGLGHRCGYVGVSTSHPLYGLRYDVKSRYLNNQTPECAFHVHGGITYSDNNRDYPIQLFEASLWWFGFDCAHIDDYSPWNPKGKMRTMEFVVRECENLARQLANVVTNEEHANGKV